MMILGVATVEPHLLFLSFFLHFCTPYQSFLNCDSHGIPLKVKTTQIISDESQSTFLLTGTETYKARLVATALRKDKLYIRIYLICMNFVVQILIPFVVLIILNLLTYRTIKESETALLQNIRIHYSCKSRMQGIQQQLRRSQQESKEDQVLIETDNKQVTMTTMHHQQESANCHNHHNNKATSLRKREVVLSRISIYIVFVFLFCHSLRIVPNIYEMICTYTKVSGTSRHSASF